MKKLNTKKIKLEILIKSDEYLFTCEQPNLKHILVDLIDEFTNTVDNNMNNSKVCSYI